MNEWSHESLVLTQHWSVMKQFKTWQDWSHSCLSSICLEARWWKSLNTGVFMMMGKAVNHPFMFLLTVDVNIWSENWRFRLFIIYWGIHVLRQRFELWRVDVLKKDLMRWEDGENDTFLMSVLVLGSRMFVRSANKIVRAMEDVCCGCSAAKC